MNILIVEDDANVALVLEYALTSAGHHVLGPSATSAKAYTLASKEKPDIALIDITLADGKTGAELAQKLQTDFAIPSIYVTGNGEEADIARTGSLGYIAKPYALKSVVDSMKTVQTILDGETPDYIPRGLKLFQ